jgi:DNA modification methylase
MMAVRLLELHRVLKPTGSLYLHCDPTASHYLKILLDAVFGVRNFRTEIIWRRSTAHSDTKQGRRQHGRLHDTIFFYTKGSDWTWNPIYMPYDQSYIQSHYSKIEEGTGRRYRLGDLTAARPGGDTLYEWKGVRPYSGRYWAYSKLKMEEFERQRRLIYTRTGMPEYKRYLDEMPGVALQDIWTDIDPINSQAQERLRYPTQKPVSLLERIISASSNEGDLVLDPFCGCGTTVHAAQKLNRRWIGIDVTHLAISLVRRRLIDAFPQAQFEVQGVPKDLGAAEELARNDKHQFQLWALSMIEAQPYKGGKKGADSGIDGFLYFKPDGKTTEKAIVEVKGGENVSPQWVRALGQVVERERAKIGVLVTLADPTVTMRREAAAAGLYKTEYGSYPKIQILTVEDLFNGERPHMPWIDPSVFKKTKREATTKQGEMEV